MDKGLGLTRASTSMDLSAGRGRSRAPEHCDPTSGEAVGCSQRLLNSASEDSQ